MFHICRAENMAPDEDWKEVYTASVRSTANAVEWRRFLSLARLRKESSDIEARNQDSRTVGRRTVQGRRKNRAVRTTRLARSNLGWTRVLRQQCFPP